jgi:tetratricopeptide (TPR) repeat protein
MSTSSSYMKYFLIRFLILELLFFHFCIVYSQNPRDIEFANSLFSDSKFEKAAKYYEKLVNDYPDNYDFTLKLARCYLFSKNYLEADHYYQKVLALSDKNNPSIILEYGDLMLKMGQPELARRYFMNYNNLMEKNDLSIIQSIDNIESNEKYYEDSVFIE